MALGSVLGFVAMVTMAWLTIADYNAQQDDKH